MAVAGVSARAPLRPHGAPRRGATEPGNEASVWDASVSRGGSSDKGDAIAVLVRRLRWGAATSARGERAARDAALTSAAEALVEAAKAGRADVMKHSPLPSSFPGKSTGGVDVGLVTRIAGAVAITFRECVHYGAPAGPSGAAPTDEASRQALRARVVLVATLRELVPSLRHCPPSREVMQPAVDVLRSASLRSTRVVAVDAIANCAACFGRIGGEEEEAVRLSAFTASSETLAGAHDVSVCEAAARAMAVLARPSRALRSHTLSAFEKKAGNPTSGIIPVVAVLRGVAEVASNTDFTDVGRWHDLCMRLVCEAPVEDAVRAAMRALVGLADANPEYSRAVAESLFELVTRDKRRIIRTLAARRLGSLVRHHPVAGDTVDIVALLECAIPCGGGGGSDDRDRSSNEAECRAIIRAAGAVFVNATKLRGVKSAAVLGFLERLSNSASLVVTADAVSCGWAFVAFCDKTMNVAARVAGWASAAIARIVAKIQAGDAKLLSLMPPMLEGARRAVSITQWVDEPDSDRDPAQSVMSTVLTLLGRCLSTGCSNERLRCDLVETISAVLPSLPACTGVPSHSPLLLSIVELMGKAVRMCTAPTGDTADGSEHDGEQPPGGKRRREHSPDDELDASPPPAKRDGVGAGATSEARKGVDEDTAATLNLLVRRCLLCIAGSGRGYALDQDRIEGPLIEALRLGGGGSESRSGALLAVQWHAWQWYGLARAAAVGGYFTVASAILRGVSRLGQGTSSSDSSAGRGPTVSSVVTHWLRTLQTTCDAEAALCSYALDDAAPAGAMQQSVAKWREAYAAASAWAKRREEDAFRGGGGGSGRSGSSDNDIVVATQVSHVKSRKEFTESVLLLLYACEELLAPASLAAGCSEAFSVAASRLWRLQAHLHRIAATPLTSGSTRLAATAGASVAALVAAAAILCHPAGEEDQELAADSLSRAGAESLLSSLATSPGRAPVPGPLGSAISGVASALLSAITGEDGAARDAGNRARMLQEVIRVVLSVPNAVPPAFFTPDPLVTAAVSVTLKPRGGKPSALPVFRVAAETAACVFYVEVKLVGLPATSWGHVRRVDVQLSPRDPTAKADDAVVVAEPLPSVVVACEPNDSRILTGGASLCVGTSGTFEIWVSAVTLIDDDGQSRQIMLESATTKGRRAGSSVGRVAIVQVRGK